MLTTVDLLFGAFVVVQFAYLFGGAVAGGVRPGTDLQDELLKSQLDRTAREAAAEQQLRELKKKIKKKD